ncbi:hypothetical protein [Actinomadura violacea]|uniref:Uncharacterized protein n=1 Tax=Actinomadura violacea TaxID=2819934 RepID=A0ABS3RGY4_9ACTN|nr:hypothetical protein [Actinomadura violacea]MBO2455984.1 hypothetical protein [Actinomadura violacea]
MRAEVGTDLTHPVLVHARGGVPPCGLEDLMGGDGAPVDPVVLIAAGQAMIWRSPYVIGPLVAVPLTRSSAVALHQPDPTDPERWHDRFTRGFAHRMAVELTIASVTAGLLGEVAAAQAGEDAAMLGSAVEGLARLLADLQDIRRAEESRSMIVADAMRTHDTLLGGAMSQRVSVRRQAGFTVHTVRSVSRRPGRRDLEQVRTRVGLPWPTQVSGGVGEDLGLARWRATMQAHGHQVWSRLEGKDTLVTELWLRDPPEAPE